MVEGDVRWHHSETLAAGQVAEFKVWAELIRQSRGPFLVPRDRLAEKFAAQAPRATPAPSVAVDRATEVFLGEAELIRRLAEAEALALFRPFPDLETVEVLARHVRSRRFLGLQVKTSGWEKSGAEQRVYVRRSSFRPRDSTYLCVLGWNRQSRDFAEDCLFIPSPEVEGLAQDRRRVASPRARAGCSIAPAARPLPGRARGTWLPAQFASGLRFRRHRSSVRSK